MTDPELLAEIFSRCCWEGECFVWTRSRNARGYGKFGKNYVHRLVAGCLGLQIDGLLVCHHCDNPPCCNPKHLFVGTQTDNMHDSMTKGRHVPPLPTNWPEILKLRPHHWQKLTADQVLAIRQRSQTGEKQKTIAADFGVSEKTISKIKLGQRWAHI